MMLNIFIPYCLDISPHVFTLERLLYMHTVRQYTYKSMRLFVKIKQNNATKTQNLATRYLLSVAATTHQQ